MARTQGNGNGSGIGGERFVVMLDHRPFACCLSRLEAYSLAYQEIGRPASRGTCVLAL
ncbi:MAG: hypothetical protein VKJ66_09625 [Synechococcus sp.]|nr:hypothetical protein [Synechococcus sp.]